VERDGEQTESESLREEKEEKKREKAREYIHFLQTIAPVDSSSSLLFLTSCRANNKDRCVKEVRKKDRTKNPVKSLNVPEI
jgi:hypothetical protein